MIYRIIYEADCARVLPAVLLDARAQYPELDGRDGNGMKPFLDAQVQAASGKLFYKVETGSGNMAACFTVDKGSGGLGILVVRQQFLPFLAPISQQITNFISGGQWRLDYV